MLNFASFHPTISFVSTFFIACNLNLLGFQTLILSFRCRGSFLFLISGKFRGNAVFQITQQSSRRENHDSGSDYIINDVVWCGVVWCGGYSRPCQGRNDFLSLPSGLPGLSSLFTRRPCLVTLVTSNLPPLRQIIPANKPAQSEMVRPNERQIKDAFFKIN